MHYRFFSKIFNRFSYWFSHRNFNNQSSRFSSSLNRSSKAFTLIEILIYTAIFSVVAAGIIGVAWNVTRIHTSQIAENEVDENLRYVMDLINSKVRDASIIQDATGTTLILQMPDSTKSPVIFSLNNGTIFMQEGTADPVAITSDKVVVTALEFQRVSMPRAKDGIRINLTIAYKEPTGSTGAEREYLTTVSRVHAIVFDSDILPRDSNLYNVGLDVARWKSGYFSDNINVGGNITAVGTVTGSAGLCMGSDCRSSWGQVTGVTGSGTQNYITKWASAGSLTNSQIFDNGTSVGIGTTSPGALLDVQGAAQFGTGNVNLINSAGKIAGISSTYFADLSGANLTSLNASNLGSGTVPSARISGSYTGITGVGTLTAGTWNATPIADSYIASASTWNAKMTNPMTTVGDIIYGGTSGAPTRLAGSAGFLKSTGAAAPTWTTLSASDIPGLDASKITSGTLPVARGGTGAGSFTSNYLIKGNGTNALSSSVIYDNGTNVGIGTTAPSMKLNVNASDYKIADFITPASNYANLYLRSTNAGASIWGNIISQDVAAGKLSVGVATDASHWTPMITMDKNGNVGISGNVGIGTTSPGQKLDVSGGNIRTTGQLISTVAAGTAPLVVNSNTLVSNLNADLLDNNHLISIVPYHSGSDFTDGTLVITDIPATATEGNSFVIEVSGKSYSNSNPPFKVIAQGYLYNNTIINASGISYGGNFASYIKMFENNGYLNFWWPRISYWNSFNVFVRNADGGFQNRVTSVVNSTEPTGTKKITVNLEKSWATFNDGSGSDLDADLLDGHDTSYFQTALTNPVTGTGSTNYISKWTGTNTQGNSLIYDNGTNVGIGTTSPTYARLQIEGSGTYDGVLRLKNTGTNGANVFFVASNDGWTFGANKLGIGLGDPNSNNVKMTIQPDGNVGIGTTSPSYKLHISGDVGFTGTLQQGTVPWARISGFTGDTTPDTIADDGVIALTTETSGNYVAGLTAGNAISITGTAGEGWSPTISVVGGSGSGLDADLLDGYHYSSSWPNPSNMVTGSGSTNYISKWTGTYTQGNSIIFDNGTNVGIGTTSPAYKLDVVGDIKASGSVYGTFAGTIAATKVAQGQFGADTGGGDYSFPGNLTVDAGTFFVDSVNNRIGVGTDAPQAGMRMDIRSDSAIDGSSAITAYGYNGNGGIAIHGFGYATAGTGINYGIYGKSVGGRSSGINIGGYFEASGAPTNYALITGSGNVGIGTTGPAQKLDVVGNIAVSGTVDGYDISAKGPNWDTAYNERRQWDGGSTNLNAATGRTSLGLGSLATLNAVSGGSGGTITDGTIINADLASGSFTNITGVGTLTAGTWNATPIADAYIASAATWNAKMTNPMTTVGDIIYGGTSGAPTRLAGSAGFLKSTGAAAPSWSNDGSSLTSLNASNLSSGTVPSARISGSYTSITGVGTLTAGTWNATAIADAYISDTLTVASTSSVDAAALKSGTVPTDRLSGSYTGITGVGTLTAGTWNASSISTTYTAAKDTTDDSWTGTGNVYTTSGNVGIGTTSPGYKLDVAGTVGFQTAIYGNAKAVAETGDAFLRINQSNQFTNGIWFGSSDLKMGGGILRIGSQGGAGEVEISGTSGDATTRISISGNSGANSWFNTGGKIGIGTTSPAKTLDVIGDIQASGSVYGTYAGTIAATKVAQGQFGADTGGGNYSFPGNVGIGTTSPTTELQVAGKIKTISFQLTTGAIANYVLTADASGNATWKPSLPGLPSATTGQTIYFNGTNWAASSNLYNNDSKVGVGTTSPQAKLHVYATSGSYTCTGVATACSNFDNQTACTAQTGCSWTQITGDCKGFYDQTTCESYDGCVWSGSYCNGSYITYICNGTPNQCSTFGNQTACTAQSGCSWIYISDPVAVFTGGRVGIGTTNPATTTALDVNGIIQGKFADKYTGTTSRSGSNGTTSHSTGKYYPEWFCALSKVDATELDASTEHAYCNVRLDASNQWILDAVISGYADQSVSCGIYCIRL